MNSAKKVETLYPLCLEKQVRLQTRHMQGVLACQKHFQALDIDILLVRTPKSGTTWLKAILFALVKRPQDPDPQQHPLITNIPHVLVPFLELNVYTEKERS
ncbi:unnamed protein product [Prunus armeniaca]|uniref:Sulfotransferase n=1 Tax=Prunus armeniaca TaxID=36596 RepID=A0A6J5TME9_PRUAR|nr:unnamed protein product [Prunus armeniaca]